MNETIRAVFKSDPLAVWQHTELMKSIPNQLNGISEKGPLGWLFERDLKTIDTIHCDIYDNSIKSKLAMVKSMKVQYVSSDKSHEIDAGKWGVYWTPGIEIIEVSYVKQSLLSEGASFDNLL